MEAAIPAACPQCQRANPPHLKRCMYCSTPLPPATGTDSTTLGDLDQLVRDTLSGRRRDGIRELRDSLASGRGTPTRPPALSAATPQAPSPPQRHGAPSLPRSSAAAAPRKGASPAVPRAAESEAPRSLRTQPLVDGLEAAMARRDPKAVQAAVAALRTVLDAAEAEASGWSPVPGGDSTPPNDATTVLPVRPHPWALVVEGCGDGARAPALAEALQVDAATARQLALARTPRAVRWAAHAPPLRAAAKQLRTRAGLGAVVVSLARLHRSPNAVTVLGAGPDPRHLEITAEPAWRADLSSHPKRTFSRWDGVVLSVPGEVLVRRYRAGSRSPVPAGERRVRIVDLHSAEQCLRVVLGVTELRGLPGHTENAGIRSLQALTKAVPWPGVSALANRTVSPVRVPSPDAVASGACEVTGWPLWEEYTRMARALAGLA